MAHDEQHTDKTPAEIADRIWELADDLDFCMFSTWDGEHLQSRPLSSRVFRDQHAIYFLVSAGGDKNSQIESYPEVNLSYADLKGMDFVSIAGKAEVSNDRAKIAELWSDFDKAWWDDANDPDIRVITVTPERGELWDSPGRLVAFATMLTAAITGGEADFGDNGTAVL
ncbi:pyridoxamine 5'-phosphate oxidase family protein [Devosia sp.]|uniref:pyridoxamine 5'-phosphate oxidase family protein n=1 Tax=Devosia sp. TaxID=1871048 RepID=UPI003A92F09C